MKMKWLAVISLCAVLFSACSTNSNTPASSSGSGNSGNTGSISSASAESAAESFAPEEWENEFVRPPRPDRYDPHSHYTYAGGGTAASV